MASRDVVNVAHSLGGLLAKKALLVSTEAAVGGGGGSGNDDEDDDDDDEGLRQLDRCAVGVCFLGTPHQGSGMTDAATVMAGLLRAAAAQRVNRSVVDVLRPDLEVLQDLH